MRFPASRSRLRPRPPVTRGSPVPHAALLLAVLTVVALVPTNRPDRTQISPRPAPAIVAALDGRAHDGAPKMSPKTDARPEHDLFLRLSVEIPATIETPPAGAVTPAVHAATPGQEPAMDQAAVPQQAAPAPSIASNTVATSQPAPKTPEPPVRAAAIAPSAPRYATGAEVKAALAKTSWPEALWPQVMRIAYCESGIDSDRDGLYDLIDTLASGANGRYIGVMQIASAHRFSAGYDLRDMRDNFQAAYELWSIVGGSFAPWGCR